jgi:hypothetical protein
MAITLTSVIPNFGPTGGNTAIELNGSGFQADNVALLLNCDGTDGATTLTDSASGGNDLSAQGNAALETSEKKFGTASFYSPGAAGDYAKLENPNSALGAFTGDWTIEFWVNFDGTQPTDTGTGLSVLLGQTQHPEGSFTGNWWSIFLSAGLTLNFQASNNDSYVTVAAGISVSVGQWYHIAVSKKSTTLSLYFNGARIAVNTSFTRTIFADDSRNLAIFGDTDGSNYYCKAYMDDLVITKGVALYYGTSFDLPDAASIQHRAYVTIDGNRCSNVIVESDTLISANTPPGTVGTKDVIVGV